MGASDFARQLGLELVQIEHDAFELAGERYGQAVRVERRSSLRDPKPPSQRWSVWIQAAGPEHGVELAQQIETPKKKRWLVDHRTGDVELDACVVVAGAEAECLAFLDADTRRAVRVIFARGHAELKASTLHFTRSTANPNRLPRTLLGCIHLGAIAMRRLSVFDVGAALVDNAHHDPEARVRFRNAEQALMQGQSISDRAMASVQDILHAEVELLIRRHEKGRLDGAHVARVVEVLGRPRLADMWLSGLAVRPKRFLPMLDGLLSAAPALVPMLSGPMRERIAHPLLGPHVLALFDKHGNSADLRAAADVITLAHLDRSTRKQLQAQMDAIMNRRRQQGALTIVDASTAGALTLTAEAGGLSEPE